MGIFSGIKFRWRQTLRFGPFRWRVSNGRYTGWGMQIWRWSWNARTGRHSIDTPGPGSIQLGGPRRRRRSGV